MRNASCNLCPFGADAAKPPKNICLLQDVIVQKDVMIVAEQPALMDSDYNRAFVSRGLKEVRAFLLKEGIDAHFTYAVKCAKTDRNAKLKPAHVKTCRTAYLAREMAIVKPKHVIVLGSNALAAVLGRAKKMTEVQGTRFEDEKLGAWIYTSLHHAQALYSEENKQTLWAELKIFAKWIKGGEAEVNKFEPPVYVVDTLKGLRKVERLIRNSGGKAAADIETNSLNPYIASGEIRTLQLCWDKEFGGVCIPLNVGEGCYYTRRRQKAEFWTTESLGKAIKIIRKILYNSKLIWHNGKFDRVWLWMWGKRNFGSPIKCPNIHMDTMHVAYLINENRRLGLKKLITSEFGFPSYDISDKLTKDVDMLFPYATRDTVASLMLAEKYEAILCSEGYEKMRRFYTKVMRRADALYTKLEIRGWPISAAISEGLACTLELQLEETELKLNKILQKLEIDFDPKYYGSPAKLAPLIWEKLGLQPSQDKKIAYTKSGDGLSTSEDALIHVKSHPFVKYLLEWRSIAKALHTYAEAFVKAANGRGLLTTVYKLAKVVTGRTASGKEEGSGARGKTAEGMNLQNIPPTFGIKEAIRCEDDNDEWILELDFSQLELRLAGEYSKDPTLLWAYDTGVDLHSYRAQRILGLEDEEWNALDPKEKKGARTKAKSVNFGYLFGMGWFKFIQYALVQYGAVFSAKEAKENRDRFHSDHRGLQKYYTRQERMGVRLGYVESLSGKRRHLPDLRLDPETGGKDAQRKYTDAVRQAINSPIQGFGSDLKVMAMIEIDSRIPSQQGKVIGEVHDSILLRVKKHAIIEVAEICKTIMRNPSFLSELGITLRVPLEADAECGPSLGQKKPIKEWGEELLAVQR